MGQNEFRRETGQLPPVSFPAMSRQEQLNWLKDFAIGLAVAVGAAAAFAWAMALSQAAWAALR